MAMNGNASGCVDENTIRACVDLNGNIDPSRLHFFSGPANSPSAPLDVEFAVNTDYDDQCAERTGLNPGSYYNFTGTAEKYLLEGDKFEPFQMCTC